MIPIIHRAYYKPKVTKGTIRCYICRSKPNILPTTLPRISRYTSTILRLPRRLHLMKCHLINRINNLTRKKNNILTTPALGNPEGVFLGETSHNTQRGMKMEVEGV